MPEIPRAYANPNVPAIAFQAPHLGAQRELADAVIRYGREQERQQLQTYEAEVRTQLREGAMAARQEAAAIADPDQFQQTYQGRMKELYGILKPTTGGDPNREAILSQWYDQQIRSEADNIANGTIARRRDASVTNLLKTADVGRAMVIEDGADPKEIIAQYDAQADATPFLMADEKERLKEGFKNTISRDVLYDQARKDPVGFAQRVEAGDFKGLSAQFLDEALSISGRVLADRDRRDAKADQGRSDAAERAFIARAQAHQLDEADLQQAAVWYKWDKQKVDQILRLQYGIKMGSPDAERLLADALAPVNKVAPTMADVQQAEKNLANLGDRVSSKSTEYTQAVNKVRGIAEYLSRQRGPDNTAKIEANKRLNNMIMIYRADERRDPDFQAQLGQIRETMRTMPADKLQQYLDNLEKLWKVGNQQQQIDKAAQDRLLGVGKK